VLALVGPSPDTTNHRGSPVSAPWLAEHTVDAFAPGVVHVIVSSWAMLDVTETGLVIRELSPDISCHQLQAAVGVPLKIRSDVAEMSGAMLERSDHELA
jgi:acyl CoA:acetate/3-ketoacid CoA transferase beta subunit